MKAKIVISNLEEPLDDTNIKQALRNAHDKHINNRDKPQHQAIVIHEVKDYTELYQDWAVIFLDGGEETIKTFANELEELLQGYVDVEIVWNW